MSAIWNYILSTPVRALHWDKKYSSPPDHECIQSFIHNEIELWIVQLPDGWSQINPGDYIVLDEDDLPERIMHKHDFEEVFLLAPGQ